MNMKKSKSKHLPITIIKTILIGIDSLKDPLKRN